MARATYSSEALEDLERIVRYISRDNLPVQSTGSISCALRAICLRSSQRWGSAFPRLRFGEIRRHVVGNYLIYYEPTVDGIDVVHVVHGARDQERVL